MHTDQGTRVGGFVLVASVCVIKNCGGLQKPEKEKDQEQIGIAITTFRSRCCASSDTNLSIMRRGNEKPSRKIASAWMYTLDVEMWPEAKYNNVLPPVKEVRRVLRTDIPREALRFFDVPGTSDLNTMGTFRHFIELPDDMLPDQWKDMADDEEEEDDEDGEDEDAEVEDED
eukprot:scaffold108_cov162-Amphora_coffeaeformis.AAC.17